MIKRLRLPPGINKTSTKYSANGSWFDSNNVRFRGDYAETIGGWRNSDTTTTYNGSERGISTDAEVDMLGVGRGIFSWTDYSSNRLGCVGTNWKFYVIVGIKAFDITPIREDDANTVTFAAVNGSSILTVTDSTHGAVPGDFVTYTNGVSLGGVITAAILNGEHQIVTVPTVNTYTIVAYDGSGDPLNANSSDSGNGSGTDASYQINVGQADQVLLGGGWGEGSYDSLSISWDYASAVSIVTDEMRQVFMDNYNEDLIICNRGGPLFYYDVSENINTTTGFPGTADDNRAQSFNSFTGFSNVPVIVESFLVSERDGHCIAFGVNDLGGATQNNLLVRWSDQNNPFDWTPTATNTAGGQMLRIGSKIIKGIATRDEILIWTDSALYSMRFIGPPDVFSFNLISSNVNLIGPQAAVNVSNVVYFMGDEGFYIYAGSVRPIPSSVEKAVFDDMNKDQGDKTFAGSNSAFNEVYWIYPSESSVEPDKYVCHNYADNTWYLGNFDMSAVGSSATSTGYNRTSWEDSVTRAFPSATFISEYDKTTSPYTLKTGLALHELCPDESSVFTSKSCYIESGDVDISDGESFTFVSRFIPDISVPDYRSDANPSISFTLTAKDFPGGSTTSTSSTSIDVTTDDGTYTPTGNSTAVRLRGRTMSMKFSSTSEQFDWRLGDTRVDTKPDGGR